MAAAFRGEDFVETAASEMSYQAVDVIRLRHRSSNNAKPEDLSFGSRVSGLCFDRILL